MMMGEFIGFLAPDGAFYACEPYTHLDRAVDICKNKLETSFDSGLEAEDYLRTQGWVILYARGVGFSFRRNGKLTHMSHEQKYFLMDVMQQCLIQEKVEYIRQILRQNAQIEAEV